MMQEAVSSLVGTGSVFAAAAVGLVFAQAPESEDDRPMSRRSKMTFDLENLREHPTEDCVALTTTVSPTADFAHRSLRQANDAALGPLISYSALNSLGGSLRAPKTQSPPRPRGRGHTLVRQFDPSWQPIAEYTRETIGSRDSWYRRLSIRSLSQHGTRDRVLSSSGPGSVSLTFSPASGASMLDPTETATPQLPPNKLVKRRTSGPSGTTGAILRRGSKLHIPSLRLPATSHQRSATLQHFQAQGGFTGPPRTAPNSFFDQPGWNTEYLSGSRMPDKREGRQLELAPTAEVEPQREGWTGFFCSRESQSATGSSLGRVRDGSSKQSIKHVAVRAGLRQAYLAKPSLLSSTRTPYPDNQVQDWLPRDSARQASPKLESSNGAAENTPSKSIRRSMSMHFSSSTGRIARKGSIRRSHRGSPAAGSGGTRNVSAMVAGTQDTSLYQRELVAQDVVATESQHTGPEDLSNSSHVMNHRRNTSSPLPTRSCLSSFKIDSGQKTPQNPFNSMSALQGFSSFSVARAASREGASTLASSDMEGRDGMSMDDEDTDFKSDTVFDSFRTMASSNRPRTVETPLDSMFDESPPSSAGNTKTQTLLIQEMLGRPWDGETKIAEEDESPATPVRSTHLPDSIEFESQLVCDRLLESDDSTRVLSLAEKGLGRLSLGEDDDDEDWTTELHLSPPCSSVNSQGVSLTSPLRSALRNMSGNGCAKNSACLCERPRSTLFDWCEPLNHEKIDVDGRSPRPKTVHGKQEMDLRGGRPVNRKGLMATHVRSQSVPVVSVPAEVNAKAAPKFGTWGLSNKTASEDWDDDFEFEEGANQLPGGNLSTMSFSMTVPASIQATQPTVKAHSGQIRELSLLVNDLKRLCRHGKDLDILDGPWNEKWNEASNIIALASPDEDDDTLDTRDSFDRTIDSESLAMDDELFIDVGFDGAALESQHDSWVSDEINEFTRNALVRERQMPRRRSVFSPEDDIFGGNWPLSDDYAKPVRSQTPDQWRNPNRNSAVLSSVIEAMQQQRATAKESRSSSPTKYANSRLFFDTNSLQELVKKAGQLRDSLSEVVRRTELLTPSPHSESPCGTLRRERHPRHNADGSPAFTRVFTDPASSPPRRLPKSYSTNAVMTCPSIDSTPPRMQAMAVV